MVENSFGRKAWREKIEKLASAFPAGEGDSLSSLLPGKEHDSSEPRWRFPVPDRELLTRSGMQAGPNEGDPRAVCRVGVLGGGTAGYLTALALQAKVPWVNVTLIESSRIPVIGVGEATTPPILAFLHHYLGIDALDFWNKVKPTWKLGINFEWGRSPDGIMAPFDWGANSIGVLGSLATRGDANAFTLQSLFMLANRVPVFEVNDEYISMMDTMPFAYHLENRAFVIYLKDLAAERGIRHLDTEIDDVKLSGDDWIASLHTTDGQNLDFDLYVDCTGFRSLLLGKALGTPYRNYDSTLITDTAVTGYVDQSEEIEPYTTATTMDAGWCWKIPVPGEDHVGYVHSSAHITEDVVVSELQRLYPSVDNLNKVKFRAGRYEEMWRGNVIALGNSYAFVEPLESSSLLMLVFTIMSLIPLLPRTWGAPNANKVINDLTARRWDGLRWFLGIHYKYNERKHTKFWRDVRETADVSGIGALLDVFAGGAPLHLRDPLTRRFVRTVAPTFYELDGVDCLLLGQGFPAALVPAGEPIGDWTKRKEAAEALTARSLTQRQAQAAFDARPHLIRDVVNGQHSWVTGYGEQRWLQHSGA
ncbi:MAG: tryptophan 7-halogenase [Acidobacteriaceae bacterium]|nr:tryptophan 7-halogenase [Acidobacteriaceae bacterium]